jgi:3-phenylpropionate/cinnamic acid dioxygenase small subunit
MRANLIARGALPCSLVVAGLAILAWAQADTFMRGKNVPEPTPLRVARADSSGATHTQILLSSDRLAIISHMTTYGHLIDEARWEDWYGLFSDDVSFEIATPAPGTLIIKGKKALRDYVEDRFIKKAAAWAALRRHTMGNIQVISQTEMTANVRSYLHIAGATAADQWSVFTTGTYNADLERRGGKWIITRWSIETRPTAAQ